MKDWLKTSKDGTIHKRMSLILRLLGNAGGFRVKYRNEGKLGIREVLKRMRSGEMLILGHVDYGQQWHYSSWYMNDFGKIVGINVRYKRRPAYFSKDQLKKYIRATDKDGVRSDGFFLKRKW